MNIITELQKELTEEYETTKKFLNYYPDNKGDWKPHAKSGSMHWLTSHIVDIFNWPHYIMETEYLDMGGDGYPTPKAKTKEEFGRSIDANYHRSLGTLKRIKPDDLDGSWDIRQGDQVFMKWSKYGAIRHSLNQITHHRAQLGIYYRLNDLFVPGSYGPSADEM